MYTVYYIIKHRCAKLRVYTHTSVYILERRCAKLRVDTHTYNLYCRT